MLSSVAVMRSRLSRSADSCIEIVRKVHDNTASSRMMSTSTSIVTPKLVSYRPVRSPQRRSHPAKNGMKMTKGTPRRATAPAAPWSRNHRIGVRSGTAAIMPADTTAMNVAVCNATAVR